MTDHPQLGDLRVWHIPQIPGDEPFFVPVDSIAEGEKIISVLADYDLFQYENRIKPDYANASGLERYEDDDIEGPGWFEIYQEEE